MRLTLQTSGKAIKEINAVIYHYSSLSPKLKAKIIAELEAATDSLQIFPFAFVERLPTIRWKTLKTFPYKLVYKVDLETQTLIILGLFHQSMDSDDESIRRI